MAESDIVLRLLNSKDKVEALEWLTNAPAGVHRNIGEMTEEDSVAYIRQLYKLGACEVVAAEIGANGKYESTDTLVLALPDNPSARRAIFESETERVEEMGYELEPDAGEKYLFIWFD